MEFGTLYRLVYPAKFKTEAQARAFARDNDLERIGIATAQTFTDSPGSWALVLDSDQGLMLGPWLREKYPGIAWQVLRNKERLAATP
jgi:hypothetical protein